MIPIFKPYMPEQLNELTNILYSGSLSYGRWGKLFEQKLSQFIGVQDILSTNSYNAAMLVLLSTLDLKKGDVVLASPMSCLASNQPFITKGLTVKWVDVDPFTGTMDPDHLRKSITSKCKVIFHNHYCGIPGYIDEINQIAHEFNLFVVDDCIEAFGSTYKGRIIGNTGADAAVYSFQTVRLPNTIEGGALIFKNLNLAAKAKKIRDYGIDRTNFRDAYGEINPACDIDLPGYGALMSEVNSYIGCEQMNDLPALLDQQRNNAEYWHNYINDNYSNIAQTGYRDGILPNFWVFGILTNQKFAMRKLFRDLGYYATGIHIDNNVYSIFGPQSPLKGVKDFEKKHLALPCGWWLSENQIPHGKL